jgi:hypothetical protein
MVSVNLQLEDHLEKQLNLLCDKRGLTKDGRIRSLVVNFLNKDDGLIIKKLKKTKFSSLNCILSAEDEVI